MIDFFIELFNQYSKYDAIDIYLEIVAVIFGFLSVWYSKNNNILVFPTGMINTSIFVYLLFKWSLLGDMIINLGKIKKHNDKESFNSAFNKLWIHGLLHLFGYDHKKNSDFYKMQKIEKTITTAVLFFEKRLTNCF